MGDPKPAKAACLVVNLAALPLSDDQLGERNQATRFLLRDEIHFTIRESVNDIAGQGSTRRANQAR